MPLRPADFDLSFQGYERTNPLGENCGTNMEFHHHTSSATAGCKKRTATAALTLPTIVSIVFPNSSSPAGFGSQPVLSSFLSPIPGYAPLVIYKAQNRTGGIFSLFHKSESLSVTLQGEPDQSCAPYAPLCFFPIQFDCSYQAYHLAAAEPATTALSWNISYSRAVQKAVAKHMILNQRTANFYWHLSYT